MVDASVHRNGMELKLLRVRAGVRQYRVAQDLGIPPSTLCEWENGRAPIPPHHAERVLAAIQKLSAVSAPEVTHGR